jgi:hypothetical protein
MGGAEATVRTNAGRDAATRDEDDPLGDPRLDAAISSAAIDRGPAAHHA